MKPYTSFRPSRGPNPSGSGRGLGSRQPFVLEPLQRGIYGARRRGIAAVHLVFQLFHHFVAVARLVFQEFEDHVLHVPGFEPLAASAAPSRSSPKSPGTEPEGERVPTELPSHVLLQG